MVYQTCLRDCVVLALAFLFLVACTPTAETATVPASQPTVQTTPTIEIVADQGTPSPAVMTETTTSIAAPVSTSTATPISPGDVQATETALQATGEAEAATLFAPTATFTPSPTFTPMPGPVWPIFFRGVPCQDTDVCEDILFQSQDSMGYLINSDGSHLTPITDLGFPADLNHPVFSADGTRLAYFAQRGEDGERHLFLANADGSGAIDLGAGDFFDYQFIAESDCLIGVRFVSREEDGMNFSIEKRCIGQLQPQELETITFPVFYEIHFSPQGDSLLVYGRINSLEEVYLLVHEVGRSTRTIFSETGEYFTGAARWLPDGETIEFISTGHLDPNGIITTTFNTIESNGNNLEIQLSVAANFAIKYGTWSLNGQEFAFTYGHMALSPQESGLYILDLNTGEWRQILSHFYLGQSPSISAWKQDADELLE
jgi:hypothetical protein